MSGILREDSRSDLLNKSKSSQKGRQRFKRRTKSRVANSVKEFNSIDMNKLFKDNILSVNINVAGETDNYVVRISFGGFLDILHDELKRNNDVLNLKVIVKSLLTGFNKDDVFINCSCPDFYFRFGYWATRNRINTAALDGRKVRWKDKGFSSGKSTANYSGVGDPQDIPSNITNPHDTLGSACKHVLLVLSNNSWLMKVASVIYNYIRYMEKNYQRVYADIMYPAIYQKPYEEPVQMQFGDTGRKYAKTGKDTLNKANKQDDRDDKGRFAQGNKSGQKFTARDRGEDPNQMSLFDDEEEI